MRVLGIDPGLTRCGIGIVDSIGPQNLKMIGVGVIRLIQMQSWNIDCLSWKKRFPTG